MHTCSADKFTGDELNAIRFTPPRKSEQGPLDRSWMLCSYIESNMGSQALHSYVHNPKKAFLTIDARTTQILTGNKVAFNLLGVAESEKHLKLKDFILSPIEHTHTFLEDDLALNGEVILFSGKVVDLVTKKGKTIPVSMWARQLSADTDKRCLVIMEPVHRMRGKVGWDTRGEIIACDQSFAELFGYEASTDIDMKMNIRDFIPTLELDMENFKEGETAHIKVCATGKRKDNFFFPLNLNIQTLTPLEAKSKRFVAPIFDATVLVYSNISGLISFLPDGRIHSCNTNLTTMLFGYSQEELLGKDISQLIPTFYEDLDLDTNSIALPPFDEEEDAPYGNSEGPTESLSGDLPRPSNPLTKPVCELGSVVCSEGDHSKQNLHSEERASSKLELTESSLEIHSNPISCGSVSDCNANPLVTSDVSVEDCLVLRSADKSDEEEEDFDSDSESNLSESGEDTFDSEEGSLYSEDELTEEGMCGKRQVCSPSLFEGKHSPYECTHLAGKESTPKQNASKSSRDYSYLNIPEGNYAGVGRHKDGTDLAIEYHVRKVLLDNGNSLYCLWVFRDPEEIKEGLQSESSRNTQSYEEDDSYSSVSSSTSSHSELDDEEYVEGAFSQHYKVIQHLTKGAFGCIKKAYRRTDRLIVITKFIQKSEVYKDSWVFDEGLKKEVPLEISLLTVIQHPNIVKVLDVFENSRCFQLVMEKHGSGMDLFEFIERAPALDEPLSSYIFRQMVSAISFLHNLQIVHRDIKDENVIIDEKFHIKLIDFGSATFMGGEEEFTTFCGTTEYCSPEVLRGHKYKGPELEMFSLGVTLFTLVVGQNPFGNADEILQGNYTIDKDISQGLSHLIDHLLEPVPEDRCTLAEVESHAWVKQPVTIEEYAFSDVVAASDDELHPVKYYSFTEEELAMRVDEIDLNHSTLS